MPLTKAEIEAYFRLPPGFIDKYLDALQINPEELIQRLNHAPAPMITPSVEKPLFVHLDVPSILARIERFKSQKLSTSQEAKVIVDGKRWIKKFIENPNFISKTINEAIMAAAGIWQATLDNSYNSHLSLHTVALHFEVEPPLVSNFLVKLNISPISEKKNLMNNRYCPNSKIDLNAIVKAVKYNKGDLSYLKIIVGSDSIYPSEFTLYPIKISNFTTSFSTKAIEFNSEPDSECINVSKYLTHAEYHQIQAAAIARQDPVILIGGSPELRPLRCILDFTVNQCIISLHVAKSIMSVVPLTNPFYCSSDKYHKIKCLAMGRLTVYLDDEHPIDLNIYVAENNLPDTDIIIGSTAIGRYGLQYSDDDIIARYYENGFIF